MKILVLGVLVKGKYEICSSSFGKDVLVDGNIIIINMYVSIKLC